MVTLFNPMERDVEFVHATGTYTFLDNSCVDVPESVARDVLTEIPSLQLVAGTLTMDTGREVRPLTLEEKIEAAPGPKLGDLVSFQHPTDATVSQTFTKEEAERLGIDGTGISYWCSFQLCRKQFNTRLEWRSHMRRHENNEALEVQKVEESAPKIYEYEETSKEGSSKEVSEESPSIDESIREEGQESGQEGDVKKEEVVPKKNKGGRPRKNQPQM